MAPQEARGIPLARMEQEVKDIEVACSLRKRGCRDFHEYHGRPSPSVCRELQKTWFWELLVWIPLKEEVLARRTVPAILSSVFLRSPCRSAVEQMWVSDERRMTPKLNGRLNN